MPRNAPPDNFDYRAAAEVLGLDADWYEDEAQMRDDIAGRWAQAPVSQRASLASRSSSLARGRRQQPNVGVNMYDPFTVGGFNMAQLMAGQQGGHLAGMASHAMGAIAAENDRRVNISRDMRRMEHERAMLGLQADLMRQKLENDRFVAQTDAANEIRKLKAAMAMQEGAGPRAWRMDRRSGQMMPIPVAGGGGRTRRRSYQQDPLTGQYRWMEDWEM